MAVAALSTDAELAAALQAHDLRATSARRWVLACLTQDRFWSAEEIAAAIARSSPGTSTSTIYRTLESLVSHGLAAVSVVGGSGRRRYSRVFEAADVHLVCVSCGSVSRHSSPRLAEAIEEQSTATGARLQVPLVLAVTCSRCRRRRPRRR